MVGKITKQNISDTQNQNILNTTQIECVEEVKFEIPFENMC